MLKSPQLPPECLSAPYAVIVWNYPDAGPGIMVAEDVERLRSIMDTFLAVGWYRMHIFTRGKLSHVVISRDYDPLDPLIIEVLDGPAVPE